MKTLGKLFLLCILIKLSACVNNRPIQYVQGSFDTAAYSKYVIKEPLVQIGDLISIVVYSDNPEATSVFNMPNVSGGEGQGVNATTAGYLVDIDGNIQFQNLGKLHVVGLTKKELSDLLNTRLSVYLKNPYYNIRFLNYKITLVGEVTSQGVVSIPDEKVNILEAIGLAGGLTTFARRDNVMIIRESNGKREFARLDLTNPEIFKSPFYFLQQNDMIVVEQTRAKAVVNDQVTIRNVSLASSVISTLAIIYSILKK